MKINKDKGVNYMEQQLGVIREMTQKKIPDKKVRTIWFKSNQPH